MKPGQRVVAALRQMIAAGELTHGQRIAEIQTAAALGVSRMPVRTALRALEQEGLVVRLGARGYTPRGIDAAQVRDAVMVRGVLEGFAARLAAEKGGRSLRDTLMALLKQGDAMFAARPFDSAILDNYPAYNLAFHDALIAAAGNAALTEALARNNGIPFAGAGAIAMDVSDPERECARLQKAHRQHVRIVEAILKGDGATAEAQMREHAFAGLRQVPADAANVRRLVQAVRAD